MARNSIMEVQFIGIGLRKEGEKNGHKYDFVPCVIAFKDKYYEGFRAMEVIIDTPIFEGASELIRPQSIVEIEFHWFKRKDGSYSLQVEKVF